MENELRSYDLTDIETRSGENGAMIVKGYAAVFNKQSKLIRGQFVEKIEKRAFEGVDLDNVFLLYNHNLNAILGNTKSKTLSLRVDDKGLRFEGELPNTQLGRDTFELVKRSDIRGVSFGFIVERDSWNTNVSPEQRTIKRFKEVREISITPFPLYKDTEVSKRSLEFLKECRECREASSVNHYAEQARQILKKVK